MSPEQFRSAVDERSDLFSLGIVLCELASGGIPSGDILGESMAAILRDSPTSPPAGREVAPCSDLLRCLLAKPPDERYHYSEVRSDSRVGPRFIITARHCQSGGGTHAERLPPNRWDAGTRGFSVAFHEALAGRGALVLIGGEPGIGKTHLTEAIRPRRGGADVSLWWATATSAKARHRTCLSSKCSNPACGFAGGGLPRALGDSAPEVAKLLPELRRIFPDILPPIELPPEQQRRFLFNAYRDFVDRSCRVSPVAVVLEDLHWADEPTLLLLQHLVQTVATMPILIIGTYRDVELEVTRPFVKTLETLLRQQLATRITLRRLPRSA